MTNILDKYLLSSVALAPEAGAGSGGAPAGGAPAGGAPAGGAPAGGAAEPFYKPFNLDQPTIDYIEGKGIKDIGGLIKVARDFETVARDRNVIAKPDTSDPKKLAEWSGWEDLGWVRDPAKYQPKPPTVKQGQVYDPEMFGAFTKAAHDLHAPVALAEQLYTRMYDHMQGKIEQMATAQQAEQAKAKTELETALHAKWPGDQYAANEDLAKRAWRALGIGKDDSSELEKITGSARLVELGQKIGALLGEDTLAAGNASQVGTSPEQARAQRQKLESDTEWMKIFQDQRHRLHDQYVGDRQRLLEIEAKAKKAA